ncbi:MAG: hypothetical protein ABIJ61_11865 [bacterium]
MNDFLPAGRLSAIAYGPEKIQIQTEFSRHPQPRVATTVTVGGRVLHKIQKDWTAQLDSPERQKEVEALIASQHREVTALVEEHAQTLLQHAAPKAEPSQYQILVSKAMQVKGVREAYYFSTESVVTAAGRPEADIQALGSLVAGTTDLLLMISELGRFGDTEDCVLHLGKEALLLVPCGEGYLATLVEVRVKKKEVLEQLHRLVEAA